MAKSTKFILPAMAALLAVGALGLIQRQIRIDRENAAIDERARNPISSEVPVEPADVLPESGVAGMEVTRLYAADQVSLPADHYVIGIVVDGEARAYLEAGLDAPESHIAYDTIGEQHVAVTFCNRTGDARVFCGDKNELREIRTGGWNGERSELLIKGSRYALNSPVAGFDEVKSRVMKWSEWKRLHPTTRIYLGDHTNVLVQPKTKRDRTDRS